MINYFKFSNKSSYPIKFSSTFNNKRTTKLVNEMSNFSFLKQKIYETLTPKLEEYKNLTNFKNLRPTIYFSISLKEQLKYIFGKTKLAYKSDRHKYLKLKPISSL
jgi:hypothetical protein